MTTPATTRLVIADDHPLFRAALTQAVQHFAPEAEIAEAATIARLYDLLDTAPAPDLILLDLVMPDADGTSALAHLTASLPGTPVVVVSARDDAAIVRRARALGARGFLSKATEVAGLEGAIAHVLAGGEHFSVPTPTHLHLDHDEAAAASRVALLTPRQYRIALMVAAGKLNKQIAHELGIAEPTVKIHVSAMLRKLGIGNRTQIATLVTRLVNDAVA